MTPSKGADALDHRQGARRRRSSGWRAYDLILAATESSDGYTGTVPEQIAAVLDLPSVTFAKAVEIDGRHRQGPTARPRPATTSVECPLPALVSVTAGVVEPRYPSFKGIMAAKSKPVDHLTVADLGLDAANVGWAGAGQEIIEVAQAPARQAGEVIEDDGEAFNRVVGFLSDLKII
jgi:electron transfer flavoprotein beta subunit